MLLLIAALSTAYSLSVFRDAATTRSHLAELKNRYRLESAILTVLMQRYAEARDSEIYLLPASREIEIDGHVVVVELRDDAQRLDLARAPMTEVRKVARDSGFKSTEVQQISLRTERLRRIGVSLDYGDILPAHSSVRDSHCFRQSTRLRGGVARWGGDEKRAPSAGSVIRAFGVADEGAMSILATTDGEVRSRSGTWIECGSG